jgi:TusA-related sulfurtransferase
VARSDPAQPGDPQRLDLRGTPCPLNLIRARLTLETLPAGVSLKLELDRGEAEQSVLAGLEQAGHRLQCGPHPQDPAAVLVIVQPGAGRSQAGNRAGA